MKYGQSANEDSELVIGIIGPIGCNRRLIKENLHALAKHYSYDVIDVSISSIIEKCVAMNDNPKSEFERVTKLMDAGNSLRKDTRDNAFLAKRAAVKISKLRRERKSARSIYLIDSLKHPEEVAELKDIYGRGFYLFAIHSSEESRDQYLKTYCNISDSKKRRELIERDKDDKLGHGQGTSKAFHLADFFLTENGNNEKICNSLQRFMDIIFGDPFRTPTFHEYAMFMAYAASIRSSDMSRQVGAVVTKRTDILATGANECPRRGGGSYWPLFDESNNRIFDEEGGRDYIRGFDYNAQEKSDITSKLLDGISGDVMEKLKDNISKSGIKDLTEYGRVVHAEMDAITSCSRRGVSTQGAAIFCTTFPCHNCAKHIIVSGFKKVIYIEPYPKSKALEMHSDSITKIESENEQKVLFIPFVGVGPRQFINFFSMELSVGSKIMRKATDGINRIEWNRESARPRVKMFPTHYIMNELALEEETDSILERIKTGSSGI